MDVKQQSERRKRLSQLLTLQLSLCNIACKEIAAKFGHRSSRHAGYLACLTAARRRPAFLLLTEARLGELSTLQGVLLSCCAVSTSHQPLRSVARAAWEAYVD